MSVKREIEYLDDRLRILKLEKYPNLLEELSNIGGKFNEFKNWTPLKLVALSYIVGPYLNIIGGLERKRGNLEVIYIDLFAGSGLNRVKDFTIAGSPIVAIDCATNAKRQFDIMYFVDNKEECLKSLSSRLKHLSQKEEFSWIKDRLKICKGDASEALELIVKTLKKIRYKNYLAFIDPYKWELKWDALRKLLEIKYGDVMITLQATLIAKEIARAHLLREETKKTISEYLGVEEKIWRTLKKEEAVKEFYINMIREYKPFVIDIQVRGRTKTGGTFKYYLIFASGRENPPWRSWIERLKEIIEGYSGDVVEDSLMYIFGKTTRIYEFLD